MVCVLAILGAAAVNVLAVDPNGTWWCPPDGPSCDGLLECNETGHWTNIYVYGDDSAGYCYQQGSCTTHSSPDYGVCVATCKYKSYDCLAGGYCVKLVSQTLNCYW
jgi:hypothetical protein